MTLLDSLSRTWGSWSLTAPLPDNRFRPALEALDVREMPAVLLPPPPVSPPPPPPACGCDTPVVCQPVDVCHQHDQDTCTTPPTCTSPPPCTTPPPSSCDTDHHGGSGCTSDRDGSKGDACGDGRGTWLCHMTTCDHLPDILCGAKDHDHGDGKGQGDCGDHHTPSCTGGHDHGTGDCDDHHTPSCTGDNDHGTSDCDDQHSGGNGHGGCTPPSSSHDGCEPKEVCGSGHGGGSDCGPHAAW